ncbi:zinc finger protein rotund-like [Paramacrobiotus metropolitanus]|uniref:zinc finger protein rotund-like n=1 Tax=Paramacrobiotus metropolitanus TaxID=2943436 RepID=UPI00244566EA|nr:zinc finger protein rotund-like [Paramacrobiotus metropolitanus]XP_055328360.1 zinc finger protein rotund-like [Paramacrobiotus metropolitanus]XP_055328361.1 zinc finger protein rotund-like [Paramacrobiotus metropolitanus]
MHCDDDFFGMGGTDMYGRCAMPQYSTIGGNTSATYWPTAPLPAPKSLHSRHFSCKMCYQIFDTKTEHQIHLQVHAREAKPYRCSQCPKTFANNSYLSQHMRIHLGIKPHRCDICQRKFTQLSHLQQHVRTHTGDKPYKCPYLGCIKAFSQLSNLQSHSRVHQTDKPYRCNSCYRCFADKHSLQAHIPKHKDSKHLKTHICRFCGKSYTQSSYLEKHMSKHAEEAMQRYEYYKHSTSGDDFSLAKLEAKFEPDFSFPVFPTSSQQENWLQGPYYGNSCMMFNVDANCRNGFGAFNDPYGFNGLDCNNMQSHLPNYGYGMPGHGYNVKY